MAALTSPPPPARLSCRGSSVSQGAPMRQADLTAMRPSTARKPWHGGIRPRLLAEPALWRRRRRRRRRRRLGRQRRRICRGLGSARLRQARLVRALDPAGDHDGQMQPGEVPATHAYKSASAQRVAKSICSRARHPPLLGRYHIMELWARNRGEPRSDIACGQVCGPMRKIGRHRLHALRASRAGAGAAGRTAPAAWRPPSRRAGAPCGRARAACAPPCRPSSQSAAAPGRAVRPAALPRRAEPPGHGAQCPGRASRGWTAGAGQAARASSSSARPVT